MLYNFAALSNPKAYKKQMELLSGNPWRKFKTYLNLFETEFKYEDLASVRLQVAEAEKSDRAAGISILLPAKKNRISE